MRHRLVKVPAKLHFLPEPVGEGGSLDGLHVQKADSVLLPHCGVLGVSKGTRCPEITSCIKTIETIPNSTLPVAETGEIVFISTEFLCFGLGFVLTEAFVDDRPDHIIVLHVELSEGEAAVLCEPSLLQVI